MNSRWQAGFKYEFILQGTQQHASYVFFLWLIHYIPDLFKLQESLTK